MHRVYSDFTRHIFIFSATGSYQVGFGTLFSLAECNDWCPTKSDLKWYSRPFGM